MSFVVTRDPRCRPHVVQSVAADEVRAVCGYRIFRNATVLDDVRGFRSVCRACATAGPLVYQALDRVGNVLYVGRTKLLAKRLSQHQAHADWWSAAAEIATQRFATERDAAREEAWLIGQLHPRFNRDHPVVAS